jgi:hypothetical protein
MSSFFFIFFHFFYAMKTMICIYTNKKPAEAGYWHDICYPLLYHCAPVDKLKMQ